MKLTKETQVKLIKKIEFDITADCTRNCWFCQPANPKERQHKDIKLTVQDHDKQIRSITKIIPDYSNDLIYCGNHGEPLLHKNLERMVSFGRLMLPLANIVVFTNGDLLDYDRFNELSPYIDWLVFDNYNNKVARKVFEIAKKHPNGYKILIIDQINSPQPYQSKAGNLLKERKPVLTAPCHWFEYKLFFAAEGYWLICCQDSKHEYWYDGLFENYIEFITEDKGLQKLKNETRSHMLPCKFCEMNIRKVNITNNTKIPQLINVNSEMFKEDIDINERKR